MDRAALAEMRQGLQVVRTSNRSLAEENAGGKKDSR